MENSAQEQLALQQAQEQQQLLEQRVQARQQDVQVMQQTSSALGQSIQQIQRQNEALKKSLSQLDSTYKDLQSQLKQQTELLAKETQLNKEQWDAYNAQVNQVQEATQQIDKTKDDRLVLAGVGQDQQWYYQGYGD